MALRLIDSSSRSAIGADRYSGFRAFSVGSHITSSATSMLIAFGGAKTPYRIASFIQGRDRPTVVLAAFLVISTKPTMRATLLASATAVRLNSPYFRPTLALEHPARP